MIFVTVGTDGPFDRLIRTVDAWAHQAGRKDVFAQIGESGLEPGAIQYTDFLEPAEFNSRFSAARLVISHAGVGTILMALRYEKPLLVMPRRASLGERLNDHQLATARRLSAITPIAVALDEAELLTKLQDVEGLMTARGSTGPYAQSELIAAIRGFIHADEPACVSAPGSGTRASESSGTVSPPCARPGEERSRFSRSSPPVRERL